MTRDQQAKILAAIDVLQKIHIVSAGPGQGLTILVNSIQSTEEFRQAERAASESVCLTQEVINYLLKEIHDRDQIIHDLKKDHPAYAVVIKYSGETQEVFSTSSLFEAKSWAEESFSDLDELGIYYMDETSAEIYEGHMVIYRVKLANGKIVWARVSEEDS